MSKLWANRSHQLAFDHKIANGIIFLEKAKYGNEDSYLLKSNSSFLDWMINNYSLGKWTCTKWVLHEITITSRIVNHTQIAVGRERRGPVKQQKIADLRGKNLPFIAILKEQLKSTGFTPMQLPSGFPLANQKKKVAFPHYPCFYFRLIPTLIWY